jgi:hypothetical protein
MEGKVVPSKYLKEVAMFQEDIVCNFEVDMDTTTIIIMVLLALVFLKDSVHLVIKMAFVKLMEEHLAMVISIVEEAFIEIILEFVAD